MIKLEDMEKIQNFVDLCESMRKSYFWNSPGCANSRRSYENQRSFEKTCIEFAGDTYEFSANCTCSCKNIYFTKKIERNGKKTTITTLKNVLKKMSSLLAA